MADEKKRGSHDAATAKNKAKRQERVARATKAGRKAGKQGGAQPLNWGGKRKEAKRLSAYTRALGRLGLPAAARKTMTLPDPPAESAKHELRSTLRAHKASKIEKTAEASSDKVETAAEGG